jgi:DNA-binding beta-propeller fold protein YncE
MEEVEQLSERLVGGKDMRVAFDEFTQWPLWWYLRDYPNKVFFGKEPVGPIDAPVVFVGTENEAAARPYLTDYIRRQYRLRWWFPEDYRSLITCEGLRCTFVGLEYLRNPETRQSAIDFVLYRDLENPLGSSDFAFYIRRDIAAEIWQSSAIPIAYEVEAVTEYTEAHTELSSILAWGAQGSLEGQFNFPKGLAIDSEGNVYVADSQNHRIQKFDADGTFLAAWGSPGQDPGQFSEPWGVAVGPEDIVYVADTWNHRIQAFTSEGELITYWGVFQDTGGELLEPQGMFYGPRDITVDEDGNLYVTDTGNKRLQKFDADGNPIGQWGGAGASAGQFLEPVGIAADEDGNLYVADTWNQRIQVFDKDFQFVRQWSVQAWVGEPINNKPYLAVDAEGRVYTTDPEGFRVLVFDNEGELLTIFGRYGQDAASCDLPTGIEIDQLGNIYIADSNNHRILKFAPLE